MGVIKEIIQCVPYNDYGKAELVIKSAIAKLGRELVSEPDPNYICNEFRLAKIAGVKELLARVKKI